MDLLKEKILITGGAGFLGTHVRSRLSARQLEDDGNAQLYRTCSIGHYAQVRSADFDLTQFKSVENLLFYQRPSVIIHLAAVVGGIGINRQYPGTFYYKNLMMGTNLLEAARAWPNLKKVVAIGTICSYAKHTPIPFKEEDLWNGYPEETNAPYGIAKKAMLVQAQAYRQEFGLNSIYLLPVNLYGPGDNFNPNSSHVIPALIKKCIDARNNHAPSIVCWGTGKATREFLYVEDAAEAITLATELYDEPEPINLGSGREVSIQELVDMVIKLTKFTGTVTWDSSCPDGQPRRCLDTTKAEAKFGFKASTSLEEGLIKTIDWYERQQR